MAKRKKTKPTTRRRRRSVGAVNKDLLTQAAGAVAGFVAGQMIASKIAPTMDNKIKGLVIAAAGLFGVPMVMKNSIGRGLALGLAVSGGQKVLQGFNIIAGNGMPLMIMPGNGRRQLAGNGVNAMVNGNGVNAMVNGNGVNAMVNGNDYRSMNPMNTALKYG
jgi:hypothetical protein